MDLHRVVRFGLRGLSFQHEGADHGAASACVQHLPRDRSAGAAVVPDLGSGVDHSVIVLGDDLHGLQTKVVEMCADNAETREALSALRCDAWMWWRRRSSKAPAGTVSTLQPAARMSQAPSCRGLSSAPCKPNKFSKYVARRRFNCRERGALQI